MPFCKFLGAFIACLAASLALAAAPEKIPMTDNPEVGRFIAEMGAQHQMDVAALTAWFSTRSPNASVLKLIAPPASPTQRSWQRYRSRFLDEKTRIRGGLLFWREHADTLSRASKQYGVPEEIIVAIIGVETLYGRQTGGFDTLEALSTLAFYYPPRAEFFRQELEQFLLLAAENRLPADGYRSSYAGALGIPQFMPGSQRRYAVDFDGDGRIDLSGSVADAIGSVAHFLQQHGWQSGAPIAVPARLPGAPDPAWLAAGIRPSLAVADLVAAGVTSEADPEARVTLVDLVTPEAATEYWLGYDNFYVITRYNRSSFYAMAVYQLAQALAARREAKP